MGRGVFTTSSLAEGELIEIAPVIVMSAADRKHIDQTFLHDYIFEWGDDHKRCCMSLGCVPLYNHSFAANCIYEMDFKKEIISIMAVRRIKRGEELFINYNGSWDDGAPLWFQVK